jgi:hypothetical protein
VIVSMLRFVFLFFFLGFLEERVILFYDATVCVIKCIYTSIHRRTQGPATLGPCPGSSLDNPLWLNRRPIS